MSNWKSASSVFGGGTEQIKELLGRRVRARTALRLSAYDPVNNKDEQVEVAPGRVGLIAHPHPNNFGFLIAFPATPANSTTTLDVLMRRSDSTVVVVNEPTFKFQFEIES